MLHLRIVAITVFLLVTATRQDDDIGYFWHLSDIHCDLKYVNKSCNLPYGNYSCDSPLELALNAINATRMLFAKTPDFVIWSGDNGPHDDSLTSDQLLDGIRLISKALKQSFPVDEVYILPVLGNHDVVPANTMEITPQSRSRFDLCHKLGNDVDLWGKWINHRQKNHSSSSRPSSSSFSSENSLDFPMANFSQTCFFSHYLVYNTTSYNHSNTDRNNHNSEISYQPNLVLISLNGLIWYQGNILAGTNDPDPLGQLNWLRQTFEWARKRKDNVLLVSHFPPGASENAPQWYQFLRPEINDQFVNILIDNADLLMTGLFAHEHVDSFRLLVSKSNVPLASLFLMPSISPLMLHGLGDFNPRIRLYRFKRSTMTLLGYSQYYFNLQNQLFNSDPLNHWQLEYDTMNTYHLIDLSANSLNLLWYNFSKEDNHYWSKYWNYELGGRSHVFKPNYLTENGLCPRAKSQCRCDHLCAMRFLIRSDLTKCLQLCKDIKYIQDNEVVGNDDDNSLQHPMFADSAVNYRNRNSTYLNHSINNQTSITNFNERSSLPYIIGVIVAFLVVLVGIVLIVNREVCNRHRVYHQRTSLLASVIGINGTNSGDVGGNGLFLNTINGALPSSSFLHGSRSVAKGNDHCTGGSCIELRTAFHPSYDDFYPEYLNKSVTSLNAVTFSNGTTTSTNNNNNHKESDRMMNQYNVENSFTALEHNDTILSPSHMISYYENPSDNSSSSSNNNNNNNQSIKQKYISKRYSLPNYAYFKKYLSSHINPTGRMVYVVNQLFDRCGHTSSRVSHIHNNDTVNNNSNNIKANTTNTYISNCNDTEQYVFNKISSTDEKSYTTSERSSNSQHTQSQNIYHHHQYQKEDLHYRQNNSCLPEDYYADDEAFGDEDHSDLHHKSHVYYHSQKDQNNKANNICTDTVADRDNHQDQRELSISSQTGYHQLTNDKKFKLNQIKKQFNSHQSHRHHHHHHDHHPHEQRQHDDDDVHCKSSTNDEDHDSLNDHLFHYDQESKLLNNNVHIGRRKYFKDHKFTFCRTKSTNPNDSFNKHHVINHSSFSSSYSSPLKSSNHIVHSQSLDLNEMNPNSTKDNTTLCSSSRKHKSKHNVNNLLTSSLTCLPNELDIHLENKMEMIQQQNFDHYRHPNQHLYEQSHSSYTSPSKYRPQFSLSPSSLITGSSKTPKHNHDRDRDHHLYPDQHILISLSLPNQTDQKLSSNLDHLNRNNDGLQHDDMNDRNHLSNNNNNSNIISLKNFPSTTKHVSIVNIPKCDYVRMSS
ncbi:unnamed protein product [Schistosoma margrebowiei]|uniref:Sphingomyelin phosphodiesterase C-terminal domain-containing protein n=1 Tax=Schistosoma margrebowiei TaxID=48269 RepID=A0AA85AJM3_9TREM|nr:unnamed protein product [Schistosoma margrebowiei]